MSLSGDDTTAARGKWLKCKTLMAALEHYCAVNGVVSHEHVEQRVPLAKYFWHRDGIAGKAFPQTCHRRAPLAMHAGIDDACRERLQQEEAFVPA